MRAAGEAVARQAGIENGDLAAGTAELQGAGETGKTAADDDDVIHSDGLRVVDGGGWGVDFLIFECGSDLLQIGEERRPALFPQDLNRGALGGFPSRSQFFDLLAAFGGE